MHQEIERVPLLRDGGEHRVDRRAIGDVAMADDVPADLLRERLDPFLQRVALIGERQFGALRMAGLRDAPGNRPIVGDAHDEAAPGPQEP